MQYLRSYNLGHEFNMNVCRSVVTAMSERLSITGFDSANPKLIEWAEKLWATNLMNAVQDDVYEKALRDGEAFVLVGWDKEDERVRWTIHERYTEIGSGIGGSDFGCVAVYEQNDPNQKMKFAAKYWVEGPNDDPKRRKTVYYPDRIEKFYLDSRGEWAHISDPDDEEWPVPWVDTAGEPLGIPVIHFKNKNLRCEAWDAIPLQDAINKELLDLLMSADQTAFRIFVARGFIPTTDGKPPKDDRSNWQTIEPGEIIATTKGPSEAAFDAIDSASLVPLQDLVHQLIMWLAMVTETPITRFITTKLIASDETLKEQENPLLSRVSVRQILFGSAWTSCLKLSRKLEELWGTKGLDQEVEIKPLWKDAQVRGEKEKLTNLGLKQDIGVPQNQLWKEAGYDQATIAKMETEKAKESNNGQGTGPGVPENGNGTDRPGAGNGNGNGRIGFRTAGGQGQNQNAGAS